jgi:hypothetical protein
MSFALWYFFGLGILQWQPTFFVRTHGLSTGELGTWLALVHGLGSALGVYIGGEIAIRFAANNERRQLYGVAIVSVIFATTSVAAYLAPTAHISFLLLFAGSLCGNSLHGPLLATMQNIVSSRMRALTLAVTYFIANLVGMGIGELVH